MPTLPVVAFDLPSGAADPVEVIAVTAGIMPNTCPFDITGHPATSVPAGLVDGLPAGLMIVGPRHADGLCLRVARAYEAATGGFPAPPGGA
jgi:amidase